MSNEKGGRIPLLYIYSSYKIFPELYNASLSLSYTTSLYLPLPLP